MSTPKIREIPGFTGYGASPDGRIWTRKILGAHGALTDVWRERKGTLTKAGYYRIGIRSDLGKLEVVAHRLIAITFIGPIPEDKEVNHINGVKTDNRVENLEIITHRENLIHALVTNLRHPAHGESHHWAKLKDDEVKNIREEYSTGLFSQYALARKYGVNQSQIGRIVRYERRAA